MQEFGQRGHSIRNAAKTLVLDYMQNSYACRPGNEGIRQAQIFRDCGFDWGNYENAPSTQQSYWVVALMRELEYEGIVERVHESGPWRLREINAV